MSNLRSRHFGKYLNGRRAPSVSSGVWASEVQSSRFAAGRVRSLQAYVRKLSIAERHEFTPGLSVLYRLDQVMPRSMLTGVQHTEIRGAHGFLQVPKIANSEILSELFQGVCDLRH